MENIDPKQLNQWVDLLWNAGKPVLVVFVLVYYRDLVAHTGKGIIDVVISWLKRK